MRKIFTLFIICVFFFRSYALNDDSKSASSADRPKVRKTNGNIIFDAPLLISENGKDLYCEGSFVTLRVTGGGGPFEWYLDDKKLIETTTSNQLKVDKVGKYQVTINGGMKTNALNITMLPKATKPSIIY